VATIRQAHADLDILGAGTSEEDKMSQQAVVQVTLFPFSEGFEYTQKTEVARGNFAVIAPVSGSPASQDYYATGGLPVSWKDVEIKTLATPFEVQVWSASGNGESQYLYNIANNTLQIFVDGDELAQGTPIPADVLADTIQFRAVFAKFDFFTT
jgi:hypothetical protein